MQPLKRILRPQMCLACVAVWLAALACAAPETAQSPTKSDLQALSRGESLFLGSCAGYCHGLPDGGRGDAPNLFDCQWIYGDNDEAIFLVITAGVPGSDMPSFRDLLDEGDRRLLVDWIRTAGRCESAAAGTVNLEGCRPQRNRPSVHSCSGRRYGALPASLAGIAFLPAGPCS